MEYNKISNLKDKSIPDTILDQLKYTFNYD